MRSEETEDDETVVLVDWSVTALELLGERGCDVTLLYHGQQARTINHSNSHFEMSLRAPDAFPGAKQSPQPPGDCFVANNAPRSDILRIAADHAEILIVRCHCEHRTPFPMRSNPRTRLETASSQTTLLAVTY